MNNSFYSKEELRELGLKSCGDNVLISRFARFYGIEDIQVGDNVRIDDFCILSGKISFGSYIHLSAYCALYGKFGIIMEDYTGLSPRCTILSATDGFSGDFLIGPLVDSEYTNVMGGLVTIKRFSQIGCNCVVFPGVTINEGVSVGAMSLINKDLVEWKIYKGIPATIYKDRNRKLLEFV